jgi:hypothetical protein
MPQFPRGTHSPDGSARNASQAAGERELPRQHRDLQNQHGGARGGHRQKPLRDSFDKIDLVAHVNAPLNELIEQFSLKTNEGTGIRHRLVE